MEQMDHYLYQAAQQALKPPPSNHATDQWLDRLTLDGFPIREILASIFMRYRDDSVAFGKYITRRAASLKSSKYKVKNFIPRLPITMEVSEIIPLLMDKYRISADGAKLLLEDYLWVYQDENQVFAELTRRGMTVLKHQQGRTYNCVFFCNEQMRNNYQRFGDVICVDFKPINIKNDPRKKNYMIGVFTGQDTNLHHTLFGISLVSEDKQENYLIVVKQFLKAMKSNGYPQSFIVGNCQPLHKALVNLSRRNKQNGKQYFGCLVGWHHLMDKIAKLFRNHDQRDIIMQKFGNILSSLNQEELKQKIRELTQMLGNDQIINRFMNENNKYFVALNEPSFIGFGIQKDNFSMLYKIMYNFLREAQTIGFVFHQALKMQQMLLSRIKKGYQLLAEKQFHNMGIILSDELRYLSIRLERKLFKKFLIMYKTAVKHAKTIAVSPDGLYYQIAFKSDKKMPYKTYIYTLHYCLQDNCWKCNCGFIYESGIPCAHLIKIIRKFRGSLTYYINRRWMIQNSRFNPQNINHPSQLKMRPQRQEAQIQQTIVPLESKNIIQNKQKDEKQSSELNQQAKQMMDENENQLQNVVNGSIQRMQQQNQVQVGQQNNQNQQNNGLNNENMEVNMQQNGTEKLKQAELEQKDKEIGEDKNGIPSAIDKQQQQPKQEIANIKIQIGQNSKEI